MDTLSKYIMRLQKSLAEVENTSFTVCYRDGREIKAPAVYVIRALRDDSEHEIKDIQAPKRGQNGRLSELLHSLVQE